VRQAIERSERVALLPRVVSTTDACRSRVERRTHPRHGASDLSWLDAARLKYGPAVTVIDLSRSGLQIETHGHPLQPGTTVVVELMGADRAFIVPARVRRCQVSAVSPALAFRGGLAFRRALIFPEPDVPDAATDADNPIAQHRRLRLAVSRRSSNDGRSWLASVPSDGPAVGDSSVMLAAVACADRETELGRELSALIRGLAEGVEHQLSPEHLLERGVEQLRRIVPARITLADSSTTTVGHEAVWFGAGAGDQAIRLLVDFAAASRIQRWHLQYLEAAAQLFLLIKQIPATVIAPGDGAAPSISHPVVTCALPDGWHRVVVRYMDGRLLKGYSRDFTTQSRALQVCPAPDAGIVDRVTVPLMQVKAVFFVRDFAGNAAYVARETTDGAARGRRVEITFLDGETLVGATLNYNEHGVGFFVQPLDPGGNNIRVFVSASAIRHVRS
jgi:hypothetical protein